MSASMEARIAEHAAAPTPPLPVASPPLPLPSPLTTSPTDAGAPLGYRAAEIRIRAAVVSPPLLLPSTSHRTDVPEAEMSPQKRACFATPAPKLEIRESSAAGAARQPGPTQEADTWDEIVEAMMEVASTTLEGVDQKVTDLDTTVRQRIEEFQVRFEEAHDDRAFLRARVNTLFKDRRYHHHTAMDLDREAVYARTTWTGSEDRSAAIEAHALIDRGVAAALAERDADRSRNSDNSHGSGTDGRRQVEKMESVFLISNCAITSQVKYASCTLQGSALTWWNSHELALMCDKMFPEESTKVERYIGGLPDMIHGSVKASKPQSIQEAIEFATEIMDKKMLTAAERQAENKRKFKDTSRNNQNQQQPFKRNNVAR
ncbi:hypothetical protein Tco_1431368, partial [Tanacetum coccineum]